MKKIITLISALIITTVGFSQTYLSEDFSTFTAPFTPPMGSGWKNVDSLNTPASDSIWRFDNPGVRTPNPPIDTSYAIADGDWSGNGTVDDYYLVTPNFDASLATVVILEFDHIFRAVGTGFGEIQVFDGTSWISDTMYTANTYPGFNQDDPVHAVIDISSYVAGVSNAQIRFRYNDPGWGWYWILDNISVSQPTPDDLAVISVDSTVVGCGLGSNEPIAATVVNSGSTTIYSYPINYTINGGAVVSQTITDSIQAGDTAIVSFTTGANFSTAGTYDIVVYTSLRADVNNVNDTAMAQSVHKNTISTFPYNQGFETGNGGWIPEGGGTWAMGTPAGATIIGAANGVNAYATNLTGNYNNNEAGFVLGPCFDFTSLNAPQIKMNVWWNAENSWDGAALQMSINNGLTWINVGSFGDPNNWYTDDATASVAGLNSTGNQDSWTGRASTTNGSGGWVLAEHSLSGAANQPSVQLRVSFGSDGSVQDDGFAFDDVLIQDAPAADVGPVALTAPGSNCSFGPMDSVVVALANFGSAAVSNFAVSYSLNGGAAVTDTVRFTIPPSDTMNFTFTTGVVNLSAPGSYVFSITTSLVGDGNALNDNISANVNNTLRTAPYTENFDSFTSGTGFNNAGNLNANGWISSPDGSLGADFAWGARNNPTGSFGTGPDADHTSGTGNFIFIEGSIGANGSVAEFTSPCIDLTGLTAPRCEFWYHKFGANMSTLYVDVFDGTVWTTVDSIVGQTQTANADPFLKRTISLISYVNLNVQVRFRSSGKIGFGTDMAIDDFKVFEPTPTDAGMVEIVSPITGCGLSSADTISVMLTNAGTANLDTVQVAYSINGNAAVIDTNFVTMIPGDSILFKFATLANFSTPGTYSLITYTDVVGDGDNANDTVTSEVINTLITVPYTESFDAFTSGTGFNNLGAANMNGWISNPDPALGNSFAWGARNTPTGNAGTGPDADHTSGFGNFMFVEGSNGLNGSVAELISPCMDLAGLTAPRCEFWYHKFGTNIGTLFIDANNGSGWVTIDSIPGQTQTSGIDPYLKRSISLVSYANQIVQVRFRTSKLGFSNDMAIDDFRVFEPTPADAGLIDILSPVSGCGLTTPGDTVIAILTNAGTAVLDTLPVVYRINGGALVHDTNFVAMNPGDSLVFKFATLANLSVAGTYNIDVYTNVTGDGDNSNDSASVTVDNIPIVNSFPYIEDFESGNGGWVPAGTNSSWAMGSPAGVTINTPANGVVSYATNLTGTYNTNEESFVLGPCFDFTNLNAPQIKMNVWWNSEFSWDGAALQTSIDAGITWQNIGAFGDPNNWYTDGATASLANTNSTASQDAWTGRAISSNGSGGWVLAEHNLTGLANQSAVLIRVAFGSDGSVVDDGFAFDDVVIQDAPTDDVGLVSITSPVSAAYTATTDSLRITVANFGANSAINVPVNYSLNGGAVQTENIALILPGDTVSYTFQLSSIALPTAGNTSVLDVYTSLPLDSSYFNDSIIGWQFENLIKVVPYFQDFENFGTITGNPINTEGWSNVAIANPRWQTGVLTTSTATGPAVDHTLGTATGTFVYLETSVPSAAGLSDTLESATILVSPTAGVVDFEYWYHMHGVDIGALEVFVKINGALTFLDSLIGEKHPNQTDPWLNRRIALPGAINGNAIQIIFVGTAGASFNGDMAIDDVSLDFSTGINNTVEVIKGFKIYPNPSKGLFTLEVNSDQKNNFNMTIKNINGQVILEDDITVNGTYRDQLDLTKYAKGIYFVHIQNGNESKVEKLIIQ